MAFKLPSDEIDRDPKAFFSHWDPVTKVFTLQLAFRSKAQTAEINAARLASGASHKPQLYHDVRR